MGVRSKWIDTSSQRRLDIPTSGLNPQKNCKPSRNSMCYVRYINRYITGPRISNLVVNNFSVPFPEIMGTLQ